MIKFIILIFICSISAFANFHLAPDSFNFDGIGRKAVWIDIRNADYNLKFDRKSKRTTIVSDIYFKTKEDGYPIFDLTTKPLSIVVDGQIVDQRLISVPGDVSKVRVAEKYTRAGTHHMRIVHFLKNGVKYRRRGVSSGFWILDLTSRKFLEQYLPTNYEFDQYQMDFNVEVVGTRKRHDVIANGDIKKISKNKFSISFPRFYTSSAVFFHLLPSKKFYRHRANYTSIDGRILDIYVYGPFYFRNKRMVKYAKQMFKELENDYGAWPYPGVIVYGAKLKGGMEYAGATATSYGSLDHEMQHSYFAKGIFPANGNSGWMDEAIASWRDYGHFSLFEPEFGSTNLGNHSQYKRNTDRRSYSVGRSFLAYINFRLNHLGLGGLKPFLKHYFAKRKFTVVKTQDLIDDLIAWSGETTFQDDFNHYVLGGIPLTKIPYRESDSSEEHNPHHHKMTRKQLDKLL